MFRIRHFWYRCTEPIHSEHWGTSIRNSAMRALQTVPEWMGVAVLHKNFIYKSSSWIWPMAPSLPTLHILAKLLGDVPISPVYLSFQTGRVHSSALPQQGKKEDTNCGWEGLRLPWPTAKGWCKGWEGSIGRAKRQGPLHYLEASCLTCKQESQVITRKRCWRVGETETWRAATKHEGCRPGQRCLLWGLRSCLWKHPSVRSLLCK